MSYFNNVGAETNNRESFRAAKPLLPQAQQGEAQQLAVQDRKFTGLSMNEKGEVSTQDDIDRASISSTKVSLLSGDAKPLTTKISDTVKSGLNSFRRTLVDGLYSKIEEAVRKEYSYDAMQARFGASDRIMSKLFLRLGPEMLAALGEENPAERIKGIKDKVVAELKTKNPIDIGETIRAEERLRTFGNYA